MVDFDNETTVTVPPTDLLRVLILQRRNDLFEALESYQKVCEQSEPPLNIIQARMLTLFLEIQPVMKRKLSKADYEALWVLVQGGTIEDMINATVIINDFLDSFGLLKIDFKNVYDKTRVELENQVKSL